MRTAPRVLLLLALAGTSCPATAANDYGPDPADGTTHFVGTGAFGDYLSGRSAVQAGDLEVAADRLEAALTLEPGLPELANQAFLAALLAGRADAIRLASSLPDNAVARLVLADREAKAGSWDRAEKAFDTLPQQGLTQVLRPLLVAWAQQGAGRGATALAGLQAQLDLGRYRPVMALHAAMVADLDRRPDDAARLYAIARTEYGAMNIRLGHILASWAARQGQPSEADRIVSDMIAANGELALARRPLLASLDTPAVRNAADGLAESYLALAATLRQQNSLDSAQVLLRLALDLRDDFTAARLLLADIQQSGKRFQAAADTLAGVAATDPLFTVAQLRMAGVLDDLGQTEAAAALLDGLAAQYPDRPEPLSLLGDIQRRHEQFGAAAATYNLAIARLGTPSRANWTLFYERGIALERAGEWPRAEADFEYALQLSPDQPSVLNYLGYAWTDQGRNLDRARSMIERAVEQRPNDGSFIDSLGWVLLRQGDAAGALKQLERAVELMPGDSTINGHLGDALDAAGRQREAEFQWRRALTLQPDAAEATRIEAKLRAMQDTAGSAAQ